jgi:anti-sigma-K factor RskA
MADNDIIELLPAYVNGTLSGEDRARVRKELESSEALRRELEFVTTLRESVKKQAANSPTEWGWTRLQRDIRHAGAAGRNTRNIWKISAVAAALVLAVQTIYVVRLPDEPQYQTLSGPVSAENVLQLRFAPDARQEDLQLLLQSVDGEIVSGPSAIGLYHMAVKDMDAALIVLENSDLVTYVNRD